MFGQSLVHSEPWNLVPSTLRIHTWTRGGRPVFTVLWDSIVFHADYKSFCLSNCWFRTRGSRDNGLERLPLSHHFYTYNYASAFGRLFIHVLWGRRAGIWTWRCPAAVRRANYSAMPQPLFRPCLTLNLAVSYPVFTPQLRFLKKKRFVGPFEHFFGTSQLNASNLAQKRTKTFV